MIPQVDFDIVDSILKVLEGWELGNKDLYRKYRSYIKTIKISKSDFGPGSSKKRCLRFFRMFFMKKFGTSKIAIFPEIAISGNRNLVGLVIASETPL